MPGPFRAAWSAIRLIETTAETQITELRIADALRDLGVARSNYFRWKKEQAWLSDRPAPTPPVQSFEALPEEKEAMRRFALPSNWLFQL